MGEWSVIEIADGIVRTNTRMHKQATDCTTIEVMVSRVGSDRVGQGRAGLSSGCM